MTMKHDDGKLRYDLLDDQAMDEMVAVLTYGAVKYEPNNWRTVKDARARYVAALRRHLSDYLQGEHTDDETGLLSLAHAACDVHFLLALELHQGHRDSLPERLRGALEVASRLRAERLAAKPSPRKKRTRR